MEIGKENVALIDLSGLLAGDIVIVRNGLQRLGLFGDIRATILRAIARQAGASVADRLEKDGLQTLHSALPASAIKTLLLTLNEDLSVFAPALLHSFHRTFVRPGWKLYGVERVWPRLMAPASVTESNRELFAGYPGHLKAHRPHRDSWFSHCLGSINLWAAIGPVKQANGVLIYPDVHGSELERAGIDLSSTARIGRPTGFELEPGDILCFHGEHLHSSALNSTGDTRVVVSARFCAGPPQYGAGIGWTEYVEESGIGRRFALTARLRTRLNRAYLRQLGKTFGDHLPRIRRTRQQDGRSELEITRARLSREIAALGQEIFSSMRADAALIDFEDVAEELGLRLRSRRLSPDTLLPFSIQPLSKVSCLVCIHGELVVIDRQCPHQGADLVTNGAVAEDATITCAWHAVSFRLRDGAPACEGLSCLVRRASKLLDDQVLVWLEERDTTKNGRAAKAISCSDAASALTK